VEAWYALREQYGEMWQPAPVETLWAFGTASRRSQKTSCEQRSLTIGIYWLPTHNWQS
jgi:hypothetical protein